MINRIKFSIKVICNKHCHYVLTKSISMYFLLIYVNIVTKRKKLII